MCHHGLMKHRPSIKIAERKVVIWWDSTRMVRLEWAEVTQPAKVVVPKYKSHSTRKKLRLPSCSGSLIPSPALVPCVPLPLVSPSGEKAGQRDTPKLIFSLAHVLPSHLGFEVPNRININLLLSTRRAWTISRSSWPTPTLSQELLGTWPHGQNVSSLENPFWQHFKSTASFSVSKHYLVFDHSPKTAY